MNGLTVSDMAEIFNDHDSPLLFISSPPLSSVPRIVLSPVRMRPYSSLPDIPASTGFVYIQRLTIFGAPANKHFNYPVEQTDSHSMSHRK